MNNKKEDTFKIRKSFTITLVIACAIQNIKGSAANHVKMKLKGSGNCVNQKNAVTTNKNPWVNTNFQIWHAQEENVIYCYQNSRLQTRPVIQETPKKSPSCI